MIVCFTRLPAGGPNITTLYAEGGRWHGETELAACPYDVWTRAAKLFIEFVSGDMFGLNPQAYADEPVPHLPYDDVYVQGGYALIYDPVYDGLDNQWAEYGWVIFCCGTHYTLIYGHQAICPKCKKLHKKAKVAEIAAKLLPEGPKAKYAYKGTKPNLLIGAKPWRENLLTEPGPMPMIPLLKLGKWTIQCCNKLTEVPIEQNWAKCPECGQTWNLADGKPPYQPYEEIDLWKVECCGKVLVAVAETAFIKCPECGAEHWNNVEGLL